MKRTEELSVEELWQSWCKNRSSEDCLMIDFFNECISTSFEFGHLPPAEVFRVLLGYWASKG